MRHVDPVKIRVTLTETHIREGVSCDGCFCPFALAVGEVLPGRVAVLPPNVYISPPVQYTRIAELPGDVLNQIRNYDADGSLVPFSTELTFYCIEAGCD